MKFTNIEMDWTDTGGRVLSTVVIRCPACGFMVPANIEHLCGDRVERPKEPAKRIKRAKR